MEITTLLAQNAVGPGHRHAGASRNADFAATLKAADAGKPGDTVSGLTLLSPPSNATGDTVSQLKAASGFNGFLSDPATGAAPLIRAADRETDKKVSPATEEPDSVDPTVSADTPPSDAALAPFAALPTNTVPPPNQPRPASDDGDTGQSGPQGGALLSASGATGQHGPSRHQSQQALPAGDTAAALNASTTAALDAGPGTAGDGKTGSAWSNNGANNGATGGAISGFAGTTDTGLLAQGGPGGMVSSSATPGPSSPALTVAPPVAALTVALSSPVASAPWQQELSQQLVRMTQHGEQHMRLHLHPRELGPLQINLRVDQQTAQAHFVAAHADVRGAVEQAIPQLREALANQGIALGEAMVGQQEQHPQQQQQGAFGGQPGNRMAPPALGAIAESTPVRPVTATLVPGHGVDLYA